MLQSFAEIVHHDKLVLALLKIVDHHRSSDANGIVNITDIDHICAKITTINTKNPKFYSRRTAWTIIGCVLLNLTMCYDSHVLMLLEESIRLKANFNRQNWVFEHSQTRKRKISKQVSTMLARGKKRRIVKDKRVETSYENVRFWEHPLELEPNINLSNDLCLVPAEQITLCDFDEPSQMDDTCDELDLDFGDDGDHFGFDEDEHMAAVTAFDENMNDIMAPDIDFELPSPPPQDPQEAHQENRIANIPTLLANSSPLPPAMHAPKKKRFTNKRKTILVDTEIEISNPTMKKRTSNVFICCIKRVNLQTRISKPFELAKRKPNDLLTTPAIQGTCNHEYFAYAAKTEQMPVDWTIMNDAFDTVVRTGDSSGGASGILQSEHGSQIRTRNQHRMSFNELSFNESIQPFTTPQRSLPLQNCSSTPYSTRFSGNRSSDAQQSSSRNSSQFNDDKIFTPPSLFKYSANLPSQPVAPPIEFDDDFNAFNQNNIDLPSDQNDLSRQRTNCRSIDDEIDQSEGDGDGGAIEHTNLMDILDKDSTEYEIISKLIRLWQKNVHPIKVEHLLTKQCNRFQAAKTFSLLLILKKKNLVQMENASDGKITHISAGPQMTMPQCINDQMK